MDSQQQHNSLFVSQEEHQRNININASNSNTGDSRAFYAKIEPKKDNSGQTQNKFQRNERPISTYCGQAGHSVDKCYKLHGYPLGYKMKQKSISTDQLGAIGNQSRHVVANQVAIF